MKYTCSIEVNRSRKECIDLWFDESRFMDWQDGFQFKNWISGSANETNSVSNILFQSGNRKIELEETIVLNSLPDFIIGEYVHIHMTNTQRISFEALQPDHTMIVSEVEYTEFHSFMPKLMAKLFPGMFRKQSQKWLDQFKTLAESNF